jgi:hypothetical protein
MHLAAAPFIFYMKEVSLNMVVPERLLGVLAGAVGGRHRRVRR